MEDLAHGTYAAFQPGGTLPLPGAEDTARPAEAESTGPAESAPPEDPAPAPEAASIPPESPAPKPPQPGSGSPPDNAGEKNGATPGAAPAEDAEPPPVAPEPAPDPLLEQMQRLEALFKKRIAYDETKEQLFKNMHAELTRLRDGVYAELVNPVLNEIAQELDNLRKRKERLDSERDEGGAKLVEELHESLVVLLENQGVDAFCCEANTPFVPARQQKIEYVPTPEPGLHNHVAQSIAPGYASVHRVIFREKVNVYKYQANEEE